MTTIATPPALDADTWSSLRSAVSGRLVTPDQPEYAGARLGWIVNVDQQPAAVLEVAHIGDIVTAVRWARDHGVAVSVQPGGHAARTTVNGTLLLRTGALGGLEVDRARGTVSVGAGVKWGELCAALDGTGLMALAGSNPDPTVVGLHRQQRGVVRRRERLRRARARHPRVRPGALLGPARGRR
jgi:FAD/FMN-containing dehydrogenase